MSLGRALVEGLRLVHVLDHRRSCREACEHAKAEDVSECESKHGGSCWMLRPDEL